MTKSKMYWDTFLAIFSANSSGHADIDDAMLYLPSTKIVFTKCAIPFSCRTTQMPTPMTGLFDFGLVLKDYFTRKKNLFVIVFLPIQKYFRVTALTNADFFNP
jgi:hypothetical protein